MDFAKESITRRNSETSFPEFPKRDFLRLMRHLLGVNRKIWLLLVLKVKWMDWNIRYRTLFSKHTIGCSGHFMRYLCSSCRLTLINVLSVCKSHGRITLETTFCMGASRCHFCYSCSGCGVPRCHCNCPTLHKWRYFKKTLCSPGRKCHICRAGKSYISRQKFRDICRNSNVSHTVLLLRPFLTFNSFLAVEVVFVGTNSNSS
jgi:hypothetical protein